MRFLDERNGQRISAIVLLLALAACGSGEDVASAPLPQSPQGPAADYPVVIGEPFTIEGVTYTPSDALNYDEVGQAIAEADDIRGVSAAHRTLPIPSYAEVTSLETGRTILVRVERRGPMDKAHVIALSPAAIAQLGAAGEVPVRVRRVNPPEPERAALRAGLSAPERMDTPASLVAVLKRKLPQVTAASEPVIPEPVAAAPAEKTPGPAAEPAHPAPATPDGTGYVVQAGAFSTQERADGVAAAIGGRVEKLRSLWRVRTGPFASRAEAEASLAKVTGKGYSGARIYRTE